jgi:uncharacterized protein (TIGR02265 family)
VGGPATYSPDFSQSVDLEAELAALPAAAAARGFYFTELIKELEAKAPGVDPFAELGLEKPRYRAFKEYPYGEFLRLNVFAAERIYPDLPTGEGLRRLGRGAYNVFVSTQIGRVLLGAVGNNFGRIAKLGCRAYSTSLNFGKVQWTAIGDREGYYTFVDLPAFVGTYQVGVVEGGLRATKTTGVVTVAVERPGHGVIHIRWD